MVIVQSSPKGLNASVAPLTVDLSFGDGLATVNLTLFDASLS